MILGPNIKNNTITTKNTAVNWLQIEIKTSTTDIKNLWVHYHEKTDAKLKSGDEILSDKNSAAWRDHPLQVKKLANIPYSLGCS